MYKHLFLFTLLLNSFFSKAQHSDDYITVTFKEIFPDDIKLDSIDPKAVDNLLITNLGEILKYTSSDYDFKKFKKLQKLYLLGDDYDNYLKEIPLDLLKIKSLKVIFLDRVAYVFQIKSQVKRVRPDIQVKILEWGNADNVRAYFNRGDYMPKTIATVTYPKKVIYHGNCIIDSLLRKEKRSSIENIILAEAYINHMLHYNYRDYCQFLYYDSLYTHYGDSGLTNVNQQFLDQFLDKLSSIDTAKKIATIYLNEALSNDPNNYMVLFYATYFHYKLMDDKEKACGYYSRLKQIAPPKNFDISLPFYNNVDIQLIEKFCYE